MKKKLAQKKITNTKTAHQNNAHLIFILRKKVISLRKKTYFNRKITKSDYISKTKIRTKNIIQAKK